MFNYVLLKNAAVSINLDRFVVEERDPRHSLNDMAVLNHFCGLRGSERFSQMQAKVDRLIAAAYADAVPELTEG